MGKKSKKKKLPFELELDLSQVNSAKNNSIRPKEPFENRKTLIVAVLSGAFILLVYSATLYRSVAGGDSGELIQVGSNLGVAHPPGYPLFTLLAYLFSKIPFFESIAAKVNFLSATSDAGAAVFLLLGVKRWTNNTWAGILTGGLFAFSPLIWNYAVTAEVFALNNFFIAGLFYWMIRYQDEKNPLKRQNLALWSTFWAALGLSNHHTFLFYVIPWISYILWMERKHSLKPSFLFKFGSCILLGFLPYLYLGIAGSHTTLDSWGNTSTLEGFLTHFFRREYGTFQLVPVALTTSYGSKISSFWTTLATYLTDLPGQVGYLALVALPTGVLASWRGHRRIWGYFITLAFVLYMAVFFSLSNLQIEFPLYFGIQIRFWQQLNAIVFIWIGLGFWVLIEKMKIHHKGLSALIVLGLVGFQLIYHFHSQDMSRSDVFRQFAHAVLDDLPEKALLVSSGDHVTHTLHYFQQKEQLRPDVFIVDHAMLTVPWYNENIRKLLPEVSLPGRFLDVNHAPGNYNLKDFFDANQNHFPIYLVNGIRIHDDSFNNDYGRWAMGFVEQIVPIHRELGFNDWLNLNAKWTAKLKPTSIEGYAKESWEHEVLRQYWVSQNSFAAQLVTYAQKHNLYRPAVELATAILEKISKQEEFSTPPVMKNLGISYQLLSQYDPSAKEKMFSAFKKYLEINPTDDPQLLDIQRVVAGH